MQEILFGVETEYSLGVWPRRKGDVGPNRAELVEELLLLAGQRVASLPDENERGLFLANGSRFYIDMGLHPELCTPECQSPEEVVRWALAGDRIIADCAAELDKRYPEARIAVFRCNVDYGNQNTWGCHESYAIRCEPRQVAEQLVSHLATRIVFSGAGGFNNLRPEQEFLLSPRVPHMKHTVVWDAMRERALIHDRDEPLCGGGLHRLHLMSGESLCSQLANYLKLGTTALVIRLAELGLSDGKGLSLCRPLRAMRAFSRDPRCRRRAHLKDGRFLSAVEVQRAHLENVERHLDNDRLPSWAPVVCRAWRDVLEKIETDPELLATALDWAIKRALFRRREQQAVREGRSASQRELCEIDVRFGELGERGLFSTLDRAGVLDHRLPDIGSVDAAVSEPPPGGRAEARGRAIQKLQPDRHYICDWDVIIDTRAGRVLAMRDPFSQEASWSDSPEEASEGGIPWEVLSSSPTNRHQVWTRRHERGIDLCNRLRPVLAAQVLWDCVLEGGENAEEDSVARFWHACASHDAGDLQEAHSVLHPALHISRFEASPETAARVWTRYGLALIERPVALAQIVEHLEETEAMCRSWDPALGRSRLQLLWGRLLVARGLYSEALPRLEDALEASHSDPIAFSQTSHWRWLAHASIRAREWERARSYLDSWRDSFQAPDLQGEISIPVAESEFHLAQGQVAEARRQACSALDCCISHRDNRYRIAACCAFLSAVTASGELANSRHRLCEVLRWRRTSLGELRYEIRRAHLQHVVSRDLQRSRVATSRLTSSDELPVRSGRAWRAALQEARMLDNRLETTHRAAEIARWVVDSSAARPFMAVEHRQD